MKNISRMICYVSTLFVILVMPNVLTAEDPVIICNAMVYQCNGCDVMTTVYDNNTFAQTIFCGDDPITIPGVGAYCGTVCGFSVCNTEVCEAD